MICITRYGKYRYPEQLQGRYAKSFFLSEERKPAERNKQQHTFTQWFDGQDIRWDNGPIYGLPFGKGIIAFLGAVFKF